ncbi:MAG: hypothetical protein A2X86_06510 [Bdellovibrionales bacterium GWA2_49_15]|nr:MAG: hypothetical protein A2X86_06510 [Bdellovibrionales bacterium GWA2_49_15]HAZ12076.1 hypothetical protein [Bdellovibrionales bacterium]
MLSRYLRTKEHPQSLPTEWTDKFQLVLQEQYASDLTHTRRKFDLFTELYPNELCFGLCLVSNIDAESSTHLPTTYIISADLTAETDPLALMDKLVDSAEIFFDQFFANESAMEYDVTWQEGELRNLKFFYKISRENLTLTQKANALLGDDFPL